MTIKYQKIDKKFIKNIIENPSHMRAWYKRLNKKPRAFEKVVKIEDNKRSEYFSIHVEENDDRRRPECCYIHLSMLNELNEKYYVLTISPTEHGVTIHLVRSRWQECDNCHATIWVDKKGEESAWLSKVNSYYNRVLCDYCWSKISLKKRHEYKIAWNEFMDKKKGAITRYFKLEKKYGKKK